MKGIISLIVLIMALNGCAAVGVPITFDPEDKLDYATNLLKIDRPLPAESLIQEAIHIYKKQGDDMGLANAYRTYALFLQSEAVKNWEKGYRGGGFLDKTVNFDNRNTKALEYFKKAENIFRDHQVYDGLTNIYLNIGKLYYFKLSDKDGACDYFSKSLDANKQFESKHPHQKVEMPSGFNDYEGYIFEVKKEARCN